MKKVFHKGMHQLFGNASDALSLLKMQSPGGHKGIKLSKTVQLTTKFIFRFQNIHNFQ